MDRIMSPNMDLAYQEHRRNPSGGKNYGNTRSARVNDYAGVEKFDTKSYSTGAFAGKKDFWMGDFKFSTKEVDTTSKAGLTSAVKPFETKNAAVKSAKEAKKGYDSKTFATRSTEVKGRSQDKIDSQGPQALNTIRDGDFKVLHTIDDVRELLNKSK